MRRARPLNPLNLDHDRAEPETRPPKFSHGSFNPDLASIARESLTQGGPIARSLPVARAYLGRQPRHILLADLGIVESPSQTRPPRVGRRSPVRSRRPQLPRIGLALLTIHLLGRLFALLARLATRSLSH